MKFLEFSFESSSLDKAAIEADSKRRLSLCETIKITLINLQGICDSIHAIVSIVQLPTILEIIGNKIQSEVLQKIVPVLSLKEYSKNGSLISAINKSIRRCIGLISDELFAVLNNTPCLNELIIHASAHSSSPNVRDSLRTSAALQQSNPIGQKEMDRVAEVIGFHKPDFKMWRASSQFSNGELLTRCPNLKTFIDQVDIKERAKMTQIELDSIKKSKEMFDKTGKKAAPTLYVTPPDARYRLCGFTGRYSQVLQILGLISKNEPFSISVFFQVDYLNKFFEFSASLDRNKRGPASIIGDCNTLNGMITLALRLGYRPNDIIPADATVKFHHSIAESIWQPNKQPTEAELIQNGSMLFIKESKISFDFSITRLDAIIKKAYERTGKVSIKLSRNEAIVFQSHLLNACLIGAKGKRCPLLFSLSHFFLQYCIQVDDVLYHIVCFISS